MFLLQTLGKNLFLPFPSFWWLPAILGIPWLAAPLSPERPPRRCRAGSGARRPVSRGREKRRERQDPPAGPAPRPRARRPLGGHGARAPRPRRGRGDQQRLAAA